MDGRRAGLLRQTIFYNFGINVHYYAMVNLSGFRAVVDAVGGVDLAVDCAIEKICRSLARMCPRRRIAQMKSATTCCRSATIT